MKPLIRVSWTFYSTFVVFSRLKSYHFSYFVGLVNPVSKTNYTETGAKIQKVAKILKISLVEVTPFIVNFLPFVGGLVGYFTTDLGADALELPLPMW